LLASLAAQAVPLSLAYLARLKELMAEVKTTFDALRRGVPFELR
jgi:hypothetical protein